MPSNGDMSRHDQADRGRTLLLGIFYVLCAISVIVCTHQILSGSKPAFVPIVRFSLTLLLAYFVYQGALAARVLLAFLSGLAALTMLYTLLVVSLPKLDIEGSAFLALLAGFYVLAAWAIFKSEPILAFWESRRPEADGAATEHQNPPD